MTSNDPEVAGRNREILAGTGLAILIGGFLLYLYVNAAWLEGARQFFAWLLHPVVNYTPLPLNGAPLALIGVFEMAVLGILATHLLLPDEEDQWIRWLTAIGMGVGLAALLAAILALMQGLYQLWLNFSFAIIVLGLVALGYRLHGKKWLHQFVRWKFRRPILDRWVILPAVGMTIVLFFIFYHALLSPIDHYDALIYHSGMAKVLYNYHGFPLVAGPSAGIQMSANYPPLYPSLGSFFFIHMDTTIVDFPLRAISPCMGLFTLTATYALGRMFLPGKKDVIIPLVLVATPLFVLYSIQALNNMMAAFFLTMTALHMILAFYRQYRVHLLLAGIFYGLAISTTYLAIYFAPAFILVILSFSWRHAGRCLVAVISFLVGAVFTGAFWYLRNLIVLGNPVWPLAYSVLGGSFIDPVMEANALESVHVVGNYVSFGKEPEFLDWILITFFGRTGFPALSIITAFGVTCAIFSHSRNKGLAIIALTFVPAVLMASSFTFFPRYFVLILPFATILSAKALSNVFSSHRKIVKFLAVITLTGILVYPGTVVAASGKIYHDVASWEPPQDYLWYLRNPGVDFLTSMKRGEGERIEAWSWLNTNLETNEKVATYESRIYYVKEGGLQHFFFLDGWEARPLFKIEEPEQMVRYLESSMVKYVFILDIVSVGINTLPLIQFLGSPYFPAVFEKDDATIYSVGPISDPLLGGSIPIHLNQDGWTEIRQVEGRISRSVMEGDIRPRLFISTPDTVAVNISFLDEGRGTLEVNIHDPYSNKWLLGLATINKTNTGRWQSQAFIVPRDSDRQFVTLGLHASGTDFTISQIKADKLDLKGYSSYMDLSETILGETKPLSHMVYLPILNSSEKLMVNTNSHGKNISVEIFEGIIQPDERTEWWERHKMVARKPQLPRLGDESPNLIWETDSGIYTLVMVLWDKYQSGIEIDLSISIQRSR